MENIRTYEEIIGINESENNNNMESTVTFLTTVDDYEHDGDTEREVKKWKSLGARTKVISPEYPEDNPAPTIEVTMRLSDSLAEKAIDKARESLERAKRTGDYGTAIYAWDIEELFSESDKNNRTTFTEKFSKEIKELEELH